MPEDWDWAFSIAYNAVLQAVRAYMYLRGYRPAAEQGHKNTLAFLQAELDEEFGSLISYFDRMRTKRNQAIYALNRERSLEDVQAESTAVFQRFVAAAKTLDDADLDDPARQEVGSGGRGQQGSSKVINPEQAEPRGVASL